MNDWIQGLNLSQRSGIENLLEVSLVASLMTLAMYLVLLATSGRISTRWVGLLWIVVILRFALLAVPESPTSLWNFVDRGESKPVVVQVPSQTELFLPSSSSSTTLLHDANSSGTATSRTDLRSTARAPINWLAIAKFIWGAGVLIGLAILFLRICSAWRVRLTANVPGRELHSAFAAQRRRLNVSGTFLVSSPVLMVSDKIASPGMTGIFRPVVLVPAWVERELDAKQIELILAHELVHVRNFDAAIGLMTYLIAIGHWFNPLVHFVRRQIENCREMTCDRDVVHAFGDNATIRKRYGNTMIKLVEHAGSVCKTDPVLIGGFLGSNRNQIEQRIVMMMQNRRNSTTRLAVAIAFTATMIAVGYTAAQSPASDLPSSSADQQFVLQQDDQDGDDSQSAEKELPRGDRSPENPVRFEEGSLLSVTSGNSIEFTTEFPIGNVLVAGPLVVKATPENATTLSVTGLEPGVSKIVFQDAEMNQFAQVVCVKHPLESRLDDPLKQNYEIEDLRALNEMLESNARELLGGDPVIEPEDEQAILLVHDTSAILKMEFMIPEVRVANPEKVKVTPISPTELEITGLSPGFSDLTAIDTDGNAHRYSVEVRPNVAKLRQEIQRLFPGSDIQVAHQQGVILLTGVAVNPEHVATAKAVVADATDNAIPIVNRIRFVDLTKPFVLTIAQVFLLNEARLDVEDCPEDLDDGMLKLLNVDREVAGANVTPPLVLDPLDDRKGLLSELVEKNILQVEFDGSGRSAEGQDVGLGAGRHSLNWTVRKRDNEKMQIEFRVGYDNENTIPAYLRRVNSGALLDAGQSVAVRVPIESGDDDWTHAIYLFKPEIVDPVVAEGLPLDAERAGGMRR